MKASISLAYGLALLLLVGSSRTMLLPFYTGAEAAAYGRLPGVRMVEKAADGERRLLDDTISVDFKRYGLNKKLSPLERKYKLAKLARRILRKAKRRGASIQKVSVGSKLLKAFKNPNLAGELSGYLNSPNLNRKLKALKARVLARHKRAHRPQDKQSSQREAETNADSLQAQGQVPSPQANAPQMEEPGNMAPPASDDRNLNGIPYSSGLGGPLGGMPPMMVNSVNMHAPMDVVVNRLNNPNPSPHLSPIEIEHANLQKQYNGLSKLENKLEHMNDEIADINKDIEIEVGDKYSKMMGLNV